MKRINNRTVEMTEAECVIHEMFEHLMDRGMCQECAVKTLLGSDIDEGLRSPSPTTDSILVGEFLEYLLS